MEQVEAVVRHFTDDKEVDLSRYEVDESGEGNLAIMCPEPFYEVLKFSRGIQSRILRNKIRFEYHVLDHLDASALSPPLTIPVVVECPDDGLPYYFVMQKVPGRSVSFVEGNRLSSEEKARIGTAIGRFAAWMSVAVSTEQYKDILWDSGTSIAGIPSRENWIRRYMGGRGSDWLEEHGYDALSNTLDANYRDYRRLQRDGRLEPTIIGHDDLSVINLKMQQDGLGMLSPSGIVDFEFTKPTTPERELRYAWAMGEAAGTAAKLAYEAATGTELSEELLSFWAIAQRITNAVYSVNQPEPYGGPEHLAAIANELAWLVPSEDWSEIRDNNFKGRKGDEIFSRLHRPGTVFYEWNGLYVPN